MASFRFKKFSFLDSKIDIKRDLRHRLFYLISAEMYFAEKLYYEVTYATQG